MTKLERQEKENKLKRLQQMREKFLPKLQEHRDATAAGETFLKNLEAQISGFEEALGERQSVAVRD